jgi:hypothetical protein
MSLLNQGSKRHAGWIKLSNKKLHGPIFAVKVLQNNAGPSSLRKNCWQFKEKF